MSNNINLDQTERYSDNDCPMAPITSGFNEFSRYIISDGQPYRAIMNYLIDTRDEILSHYKKNPEDCDCNMSAHLFAEMLREVSSVIDRSRFREKE